MDLDLLATGASPEQLRRAQAIQQISGALNTSAPSPAGPQPSNGGLMAMGAGLPPQENGGWWRQPVPEALARPIGRMFGVGGYERYQPWPERMVRGLWQDLTDPPDPRLDPDAAVTWAARMGMNAIGGGMAFAPRGALGSAGGRAVTPTQSLRPLTELPMDTASRMARAEEGGYLLDMPLYHGTAGFKGNSFDPALRGDMTGATSAHTGVWSSMNPKDANLYAAEAAARGRGAPEVIPLVHRAEKPASLRLTGKESEHEVAATIQDTFDRGHDSVMVRFPEETGRLPHIVVKNENQYRSPNAVFDPAKRDSSSLLAGIAGALAAPTVLDSLSGGRQQ